MFAIYSGMFGYGGRASLFNALTFVRFLVVGLIFVTAGAVYAAPSARSTTPTANVGFDVGLEFEEIEISGQLRIDCSYDNGEAHVNGDCLSTDLAPSPHGIFFFDGNVPAKKIRLSVTHAKGGMVKTEIPYDAVKRVSEWAFNLWFATPFEDALLRPGLNAIHFEMLSSSDQLIHEGRFEVTVADNGRKNFCRPGRMVDTGSFASCRYPVSRKLCSQYFRYENYCR